MHSIQFWLPKSPPWTCGCRLQITHFGGQPLKRIKLCNLMQRFVLAQIMNPFMMLTAKAQKAVNKNLSMQSCHDNLQSKIKRAF